MKKMLIIVNPFSGKGKNSEIIPYVTKILSQKYECIIYKTSCPGDGEQAAENASDDIDVITCIGGDGTMSEVASGVSKNPRDIPIGYIPTGTTNDFAKGLGIPLDYISAAQHILNGKRCV